MVFSFKRRTLLFTFDSYIWWASQKGLNLLFWYELQNNAKAMGACFYANIHRPVSKTYTYVSHHRFRSYITPCKMYDHTYIHYQWYVGLCPFTCVCICEHMDLKTHGSVSDYWHEHIWISICKYIYWSHTDCIHLHIQDCILSCTAMFDHIQACIFLYTGIKFTIHRPVSEHIWI